MSSSLLEIKQEELIMFAEKTIRWSGIALALGGIFVTLFWILHPEESILLTDPDRYQREHLLDVIGTMLLIPGLAGLYARLANRTRWLGFTAFLLTFFPMLVLVGISVVDFLIWPSIARVQPDLILTAEGEFIQTNGPFSATISLIVPFSMVGALGFILLGIAVWRSESIAPRWVGLLLAISGPAYMIGPGFVSHGLLLPNLLVFAPFAVTTLLIGMSILNHPEEPMQRSVTVRAEPIS